MRNYEVYLEGFSLEEVRENPMLLTPYRSVYETLRDKLLAGYPIPDESEVGIFGNNHLLEKSFRLRDMDREPLKGVRNPGKSATIVHTRIRELACITHLGRPLKREDRLYVVPSSVFREIGFSPIYAPTSKRPLHVRLVPDRLNFEGDIPQDYRIQLARLVQGYQISRETN